MEILAFLVLAGLGLVVLWTFRRQQRNRDRWPYNLGNTDRDTSGATRTDIDWNPTTPSLILAGATVLDDNDPSNQARSPGDTGDSASTSWSEHGATGSWGEGETSTSDAGVDSGDSGGGDGGGSND